ncbi:hypothetical protein GCK72_020909 [Caenorhabditis remanei]|uniref:DUF38 domain-containing protein n=1 Tax=Caenorhabditis remanei TaxID=31234 RepID=A0A6A5GIX0_CAERE|nr:hypothetical protein GCK72_020909 [Caenorhabditis remanei]KAF1754349.1 hypothetical protein GCK72_020909 [Caenorhabditis remanei]
MSRFKPLAYQPSKAVLEYISFGKRKHLYAMCPAIRKMEEILPYHLKLVELDSNKERDYIAMMIDSFSLSFLMDGQENNMSMRKTCSTKKRVYWLTSLGPEQAAEKFVLYNLSREGTRIKNVAISVGPEFISKCVPIAIKNLRVNRTTAWFPTNIPIENVAVDTIVREDTLKMAKHVTVRLPERVAERINTEIVSEWNCESIQIDSSMRSEEIADYCNKVSKRTDRPIGSRLDANHNSPVEFLFEILHSNMNARKTVLNNRTCAAISIVESTELNVYGSTDDDRYVIVEVCVRGTAIDQVV